MAKSFEYAASVDREGRFMAEGAGALEPADDWTAEHLVLAGLMRCTLESLRFHATHRKVEVEGMASADAVVTRRQDGRYGIVDVECRLDVELVPAPAGKELVELLDLAERDCFVGASLMSPPTYVWRVNGEDIR
ncbi:MAG TPA: OsmC family protein [Gaiellaceae bacterium]|nr:OsmC family protein [Gaiellaceae bacterium]